MRVLKLGLISVVIFGVLIYLFSLIIPDHVRISRAINIAVAKDTLSRFISDMRTWEQWNEMVFVQDSSAGKYDSKSYNGRKLQIDLVSANSDSVITNWQHGSSETIRSGFNLVQSLSDTTVAQWYFDFHLKWYPWEKFGSIIFDQQLGPAMEKSLRNLKETMENQPPGLYR
jgi:hypothetical protein